jgi:basic amino acid/polyamine antiporter, APA family
MGELKKVLDYKTVLLITINAIMGTGIFFLPAVGAREAGPASILSWAILSVLSVYIAACFGELTSMYPKSGGIYEFCKQAYGRFFSFLIGWTSIIAGNITIAMLIVGAIQYLLPVEAPLIQIPISLFFIFVFNYIAFRGMQTSAVMLVAFSFITLGSLISLIIPGLFKFSFQNFTPFTPFGGFSIFIAIFFIAETFFGWETATFLAEETKDGERVMPKALVTGTIIIAIISLLLVVASLSIMNWESFGNSAAPLQELGFILFGPLGKKIFTIWVYLAIIGSVAGWIVSAPRLLLAMSRDKLFLKQFSVIHKKYGTPHKAIIFQTILSSILVFVGSGSYETLLTLLVPLVLVMYAAVLISVTVLRIRKPDQKRYYNVWFPKLGPIIVAFLLIGIVFVWLFHTENAWLLIKIASSFVLLGIPVYLLLEMYYDPGFIRKVNSSLVIFALLTESFILPRRIRRQIGYFLGDIRGKTVLELGCSVGTMTKFLAEKVGKKGKLIATDISVQNINVTHQRLKKYAHVKVLHHKNPNELHPEIPDVDVVVSISNISNVQEVSKLLKRLNSKLDKGNIVCFLEYDNFFKIIPNVPWLASDDGIKNIFSHSGFEVDVIRMRGWLWQYVYIVGTKEKNV